MKCLLCGKETDSKENVCEKCKKDYEITEQTMDGKGLVKLEKKRGGINMKKGCFVVACCVFAFFVIMGWIANSVTSYIKKDIEEQEDIDSNNNEFESKSQEDSVEDLDFHYNEGKLASKKKCKFTFTGGNKDGFSIEIKNGSKKDYSFDVHSMSINGKMTNCNIFTATTGVPSKKKGIMNVEFEEEWLEGITDIKYIDLIIWAYDEEKEFKDFETDIIRIKTNKYSGKEKSNKQDGTKTNGLIVKKEMLDEDTLKFSVVNKNKNYVEFDFQNSSINGLAFPDDYLLDAIGVNVYPESQATISIDISEFTEKNGIKKVKNAEFSLRVRDKGDYFKEKTTKKIKFKN